MNGAQLRVVLEQLGFLREAEIKLADFYFTCGIAYPEYYDFWSSIIDEEQRHASYITELARLASADPASFTPGLAVNPAAIRTFVDGIDANIDRLKKGEISLEKVLFVARDIENSVIESKYFNAATSLHPEYVALAKKIIQETTAHRIELERMIREIKKGTN